MTTLALHDVAPSDWHALSLQFRDLTFEQTRSYCEHAASRIGGKARFVAVRDGSDFIALAALRQRSMPGLRRGIIWLPAGPLIRRTDRAEPTDAEIIAVLAALRQHLVGVEGNILRLRFSVLGQLAQDRAGRLAEAAGFARTHRAAPYKSYVLDTRVAEEESMARLNGKWRGHLRNAFRAGLSVESAADATLSGRFDRVMASVQEAKGFAATITPAFHRRCQGEGYTLETFVVSREGRDLSAGMIVVTGNNANYLFGATNAEGRDHRSGYQLTWSIMMRCGELGVHWLDLGGVDNDLTPELTLYKERTGATYSEGAGPFEATPGGLFPRAVNALEDLRGRMRGGKG